MDTNDAASAVRTASIAMSSGPRLETSAHRVFIVEDEVLIRMLLEDMLDDLGHQVAGSVGGIDEAAAMARTIDCDFAVLDVNLEGREVYPVAEILRQRGLPFAFVTGYGGAGVTDAFRQHPTLQKPFQVDDLRRTIAALLA
jgi:CheY-like chemotaxis protein